MAGRVNTKFVVLLSAVMASIVLGMGVFWYVFVHKDPAELVHRGDQLMEQGDAAMALEFYGKAIARQRDDVRHLDKYLRALEVAPVRDRTEAQKYFGQLRDFTRVAADQTNDPERIATYYSLLLELARDFGGTAFLNELHEHASGRLKGQPDDVLARKYRGIAQVNRLNVDMLETDRLQAKEDLLLALEAMPKDEEIGFHLALWHMFEANRLALSGANQQEIDAQRAQALEALDQMLAVNPEEISRQRKYLQIVSIHPVLERGDHAREVVTQLEAQLLENPQPTEVVLSAADMLMRLFDEPVDESQAQVTEGLVRARRLIEAAAAAHPGDVAYELTLGRIYETMGDEEAALAQYEAARTADGGLPATEFLLAREHHMRATLAMADLLLARTALMKDAKDRQPIYEQVEELVKTARAQAPQAPQVNLLEGKLKLAQGQLGEASVLLSQADQQFGDRNPEARLLTARTHWRTGNWGAAAELMERLVAAAPGAEPLRLETARIYLDGGDLEKAQRHVDYVMRTQPENGQALMLQAQLHVRRGEKDKAVALIDRLDPQANAGALSTVAGLYVLVGERDKARELLENAFQQDPNMDLRTLQMLFALVEDPERVSQMMDYARQQGVDTEMLAILNTLLSNRTTNPDEMIEQLASRQDSELEQALTRMQLYRMSGDEQKLRDAVAEAAELAPNNAQVIDRQYHQALADKNWTEAARLAQLAGQQNLDLAKGAFFQARLASARGRLTESIAHYRRGLAARPVFADGWRQFAEVLARNGDTAEAANAFKKSLEQRPNHLPAMHGLASVQDSLGQRAEALRTLRQAAQLAEGDMRIIELYLRYEEQHGDRTRSLEMRRGIAKARPQEVGNRHALAILLADQNLRDEALEVANGLLAEFGTTTSTLATLANVHRILGEAERGDQMLRDHLASRGAEATSDEYLVLARYRVASKNDEGTLEAYRQAIALEDSKKRTASREFADLLFDSGNLEQATGYYEQLHQQNPDDPRVTLRLAEAMLRTGRADEAAAVLEPIKNQPTARALRAMVSRERGSNDEALQLIEEALEQDPRNARLHHERALTLAKDPQRLAAAESSVNDALSRDPNLAPARELLAKLLLQRGDVSGAMRELRTLLAQRPGNTQARLQLVELSLNQRDLASAKRLLREGAAASPGDASWPRLLAQVAAMDNQPTEAVEHWRQTVALAPTPDNVNALALALLTANQPEQTLAVLHEHASMTEQIPLLTVVRGRALLAAGQPDAARRTMTQALANSRSAEEVMAVADHIGKAFGPSTAVSELASMAAPNLPQGWLELARAQMELNARQYQPAAARLKAMQPGEDIRPHHQRLLGVALQHSGAYAEARAVYEQMLQATPDDPAILNNLAYLLTEQMGEPQTALPLVEKAAQQAPDNPHLLDTLGWTQYKVGRLDEARLSLERSVSLQPLAASSLHLAIVYKDLGLSREARAMLEQAKRLAEETEDAEILEQANSLLNPQDA